MKYQLILFSIVLVAQVTAIDLSSLLSDSTVAKPVEKKQTKQAVNLSELSDVNATKPIEKKQNKQSINLVQLSDASVVKSVKKKQKSVVDLGGLTINTDPDFQKAISILNDRENKRIYDDYLDSINQSFMQYDIANLAVVKKVVKERKSVDLSALENAAHQVTLQKNVEKPKNINLSSLLDVSPIKTMTKSIHFKDQKNLNLGSLVDVSSVKNMKKTIHSNHSRDVDLSSLLSN